MNDDQIALLEKLFRLDPPPNSWNIKLARLKACYELAYEAAYHGSIVDLGAWRGASAIAMALAVQDWGKVHPSFIMPIVYTVDDYMPRIPNHIPLAYGPDDHLKFVDNVAKAGCRGRITLIWNSIEKAAPLFGVQVSLVVWDIWHSLPEHFALWSPMVKVGGVFAIHDHIDQFGRSALIQTAIESGDWEKHREFPGGGMYTIRRIR